MRKTLPVIPIIIFVSLLLSGCGLGGGIYANYRPIGQLRPVETLGLDAAAGGVLLSAATGGVGDAPPLLLRRGGDSLLSAMEQLQDYTGQGQLFFAHTRFLLLGEAYARDDLAPLLDYVERDMHLRTGVAAAVLLGGEAAQVLTGAAGGDATEMLASLRRDVLLRGESRFSSVRELAAGLSEDGAALICALSPRRAEGSVFPEGEGVSAVPAGYGILKGTRVVGWLTGDEARCASLLLGHPGVQRRTVEAGGGRYVLELDSVRPSLRARRAEGRVTGLELTLTVRFAVAERLGPLSGEPDTELASALCAAAEAELEREIRAVLGSSRALDADFLRLGRTLSAAGSELSPTEAEVAVSVTAVLDRGGDVAAPIRTGGAAA